MSQRPRLVAAAVAAALVFTVPQEPARVQDPAPAAPAQFGPDQLPKLSWISGTWTLTEGNRTTEEHWRPLQGTTLVGCSHTYDAKKTLFFEFLRIGIANGAIAYLAQPGGKPVTVFPLAKLEDGVAVFENEKHDHPQRIRYERTATGMTATISQLDGSRAQSFVFQRAQ